MVLCVMAQQSAKKYPPNKKNIGHEIVSYDLSYWFAQKLTQWPKQDLAKMHQTYNAMWHSRFVNNCELSVASKICHICSKILHQCGKQELS